MLFDPKVASNCPERNYYVRIRMYPFVGVPVIVILVMVTAVATFPPPKCANLQQVGLLVRFLMIGGGRWAHRTPQKLSLQKNLL